jgi:TRAP-type C4-dicarboxylate transport system substrate-binding protein
MGFGSIVPEGTPWADELKVIKARVEKESGGRMKVPLFLGGRRGSENDMLVEVRRGKLQGAALSTGSLAAEVPELQALEFPYLFENVDEVDAVLEGPIGATLVAKVAEKGLLMSIWGENGWRSIGTRSRPVRKPADVVDLKVRAQESRINVAFWKSLRASATQIPLNEVLSAIRTGVIDGFDQTPLYMVAAGWHAEIQHFSLTEHSYQGGGVIYNKRFVDALPDDLRAIVLADAALQGRRNRKAVREESARLLGELEKNKVQVHALSEAEKDAFREATRVVYEQEFGASTMALVREIRTFLEERRKAKRE